MKLYHELADWWPLLSAPEEYEEGAAIYAEILRSACVREPKTLLELGSGGGNNACYMKRAFELTLTDRSSEMLGVSRTLNPECEHLQGDMRHLRLHRTFDCVFIHDAVVYLTTEEDLRKALETAYVHCAPGGAALFCPDYTQESFCGATAHGGYDGEDRALRYLQWDHDPNPDDQTYQVDFAFMLREKDQPVQLLQDFHVCGLFSVAQWEAVLRDVGFAQSRSFTLETDSLESGYYRVFVAHRD